MPLSPDPRSFTLSLARLTHKLRGGTLFPVEVANPKIRLTGGGKGGAKMRPPSLMGACESRVFVGLR